MGKKYFFGQCASHDPGLGYDLSLASKYIHCLGASQTKVFKHMEPFSGHHLFKRENHHTSYIPSRMNKNKVISDIKETNKAISFSLKCTDYNPVSQWFLKFLALYGAYHRL